MEIDMRRLRYEVSNILEKGYRQVNPGKGVPHFNVDGFRAKTIWNFDLTHEELLKILLYTSKTRPSVYERMITRKYVDFDTYIDVLELNFDTIEFCPVDFYTNSEYLKKIVEILIKNKDKVNYDALPESVAQMEEVKQAFNRNKQMYTIKNDSTSDERYDRSGYNIDWNDKEGNLIHYFSLPGNFKISSKEDYIKLVEEYKKSNLSIPAFCRKYYITNVDGFKDLIDRLRREKISEEDALTKHSMQSQKVFWETSKKVALAFVSGKINIEEWLRDYYNPFQTVGLLVSTLEGEKREKFMNMLADQTKEYIFQYENEAEVEKLATLYGADSKFRINGQSKLSIQLWKFFREKCSKPVDFSEIKKACNIVTSYSQSFSKKNVPLAVEYSGVRYDVTKEQADQVFAYLDYRNLVRCPRTFNYFLKKVVTGELDFSEQTKNARAQMKENIILLGEQLKEKANVDAYLEVVGR